VSTKLPVIHGAPEILSGTPVFARIRVPVQSLFDYLDGGDTLDGFLTQFPSVRREQAVAALEFLPGVQLDKIRRGGRRACR
jgi:uncharacterized protein (DUF433 family)